MDASHPALEAVAAGADVGQPGPDLRRLRRLPEPLGMLLGERLEGDERALEARRQRLAGVDHRAVCPGSIELEPEGEPLEAGAVHRVALGDAVVAHRLVEAVGLDLAGPAPERDRRPARRTGPAARNERPGRGRSRGRARRRRPPGARARPRLARRRPARRLGPEQDDDTGDPRRRPRRRRRHAVPRRGGEIGLGIGIGPAADAEGDVGLGPERGDVARRRSPSPLGSVCSLDLNYRGLGVTGRRPAGYLTS